jgi:hypothetical protein
VQGRSAASMTSGSPVHSVRQARRDHSSGPGRTLLPRHRSRARLSWTSSVTPSIMPAAHVAGIRSSADRPQRQDGVVPKCEFSERDFEFCANFQLQMAYGAYLVGGRPAIPSQVMEAASGYDAAYRLGGGAAILIQYKVADFSPRPWGRGAATYALWGCPYFRAQFHQDSSGVYMQHNTLLSTQAPVIALYVAPCFSTSAELSARFAAGSGSGVIDDALLAPGERSSAYCRLRRALVDVPKGRLGLPCSFRALRAVRRPAVVRRHPQSGGELPVGRAVLRRVPEPAPGSDAGAGRRGLRLLRVRPRSDR